MSSDLANFLSQQMCPDVSRHIMDRVFKNNHEDALTELKVRNNMKIVLNQLLQSSAMNKCVTIAMDIKNYGINSYIHHSDNDSGFYDSNNYYQVTPSTGSDFIKVGPVINMDKLSRRKPGMSFPMLQYSTDSCNIIDVCITESGYDMGGLMVYNLEDYREYGQYYPTINENTFDLPEDTESDIDDEDSQITTYTQDDLALMGLIA